MRVSLDEISAYGCAEVASSDEGQLLSSPLVRREAAPFRGAPSEFADLRKVRARRRGRLLRLAAAEPDHRGEVVQLTPLSRRRGSASPVDRRRGGTTRQPTRHRELVGLARREPAGIRRRSPSGEFPGAGSRARLSDPRTSGTPRSPRRSAWGYLHAVGRTSSRPAMAKRHLGRRSTPTRIRGTVVPGRIQRLPSAMRL